MLIWVFTFIIAAFLLSLLMSPRFSRTNNAELNYGEILDQAESGNISSVDMNVSGNARGTFRNPVDSKMNFTTSIPVTGFESLAVKIKGKNPYARINIRGPSMLSSILFTWGPILLIIGVWIFFINRMRSGGGGTMSFGKSKTKLAQSEKKATFKDVAGVEEAKSELQETVEFLKEPQKFQKLGGRLPKGVLLMGPPGSGKTLLARAVAGEANVPFFFISGSDFVEMFVGVGASRVRDLFEQGKKNAPCIIFIDEIDAVGRRRGTGIGGGHDEREQTLNQLLVELDGFEDNEGVIIIAATNRPDVLDPALLRPGRFDRRVVVDKPDIRGRENILKIHTQKVVLDEKINISDIAKGTPGFCGADLANLVNEAALNAARCNQPAVTQRDLEFAKDKITMGSERKTLIISDDEKRTTAVHEAGHALVTTSIPKADPLHKVTIIPHGMALGITTQLPTEDRHSHSKKYLESQLAILMGGRCAEEIMLDQQTTGAKNDIERATEIAYQMVCEFGMSELGPLNFVSKSENPFLGKQLTERSYNCSEETARRIDKAIKLLIDRAYETAKKIITEKREALERLATALIENEVLDGNGVRKIIDLEST